MKKHVIWYNLLFLEYQDKTRWGTLFEDLDQNRWDPPAEDLDQIKQDTPDEELDQISWDTSDEDLEKDRLKDIDLLSIYFDDLKSTGPLLDHEQEFWLALDVRAGLRMNQPISSDGICGVYGDLRDNWNQYFSMIGSLRLPSIDWNGAVSVMAQQRLDKEHVRFSEIFPWLESVNEHIEVRQKISQHATQIYLDLIILPDAALSMIAGHFAKDDLALPDWNEIDHWFTANPAIEWPVDEILTQANQAKKRLILSNLRFVIFKAKKYYFSGVEFEDLIQQGNLGLIQSIDGYDPSMGYRFSTYADSWIKKEITLHISDYSSIFYFSEDKSEKRKLVYKARERLCQQLRRLPTAKEIAETLGSITASEIANLLELDIKTISCDESVDESDNFVLEDIIEDPNPTDLIHVVDLQYLEKDIQIVLSMLPARQREVIKLRFGFDGQPRTFKEVGDYLVIHWERIRKIEKDALNYLRYSARFNLLKDYLE